jgi:hypothetical protein
MASKTGGGVGTNQHEVKGRSVDAAKAGAARVGALTEPDSTGDAIEAIATLGPVCVREYDNALPRYRPDLVNYASALSKMTDQELMVAAEDAIYTSALVSRFKGNWEHDHFKASACYSESERRAAASGRQGCVRHSIYDRAYRRAFESGTGQKPGQMPGCTCPPAT